MTIVWKIKRGQIRPHVLKSYNLVLFDVTIVFWITHWLLFGNAEFRGSHYSGNDRSSSKKSQMRHKESIWENDELLRQYFSRKTGAWLLSQHRFLLVLVARSTTKNFDQSIHDCLFILRVGLYHWTIFTWWLWWSTWKRVGTIWGFRLWDISPGS